MAEDADIAKMQFAIENPHNVRDAGTSNAYVYSVQGKNKNSPTILCERIIGENSYYVIQTVADTKSKTLYVVSAYIGKSETKKEALQSTNAQGPDETAKTAIATSSTNSISQNAEKVNIPKHKKHPFGCFFAHTEIFSLLFSVAIYKRDGLCYNIPAIIKRGGRV